MSVEVEILYTVVVGLLGGAELIPEGVHTLKRFGHLW